MITINRSFTDQTRHVSRRIRCAIRCLAVTASVASMAMATMAQAQTEILLSKNALTTASSELQAANLAVDGSLLTRWESTHGVNTASITLDLGNSYDLSRAIIRWEAANAANYTLQGSTNNSTWTTLTTQTNGQFGARTDTLTVSGNYRYVRMNGTARSATNTWDYSIFEFEVYGFANGSRDTDGDGVVDSLDKCANTPLGVNVDAQGCETALPLPWTDSDIGNPKQGTASYLGTSFTTAASGVDIWGTSDSFHFVYQPVVGDISITAQIASLDAVNPWAKAGVMIRDGLAADAKNLFTGVTVANGASFQRRITTGGVSTSTKLAATTVPYWVRLVRKGDVFTSYLSSNGTTWTLLGTEAVALGTQVYVGLAHTSHDPALVGLAKFDKVEVQSSLWSDSDIGTPLPGSLTYSGNALIIRGSGNDIWAASDNFHFAYQPFKTDGSIIAKLASLDPTNPWAKAGVMIRDGVGADAKNALVAITSANGATFQNRTSVGGISVSIKRDGTTTPYWLKISRNGSTLSGFVSSNGADWEKVGSATISLGANTVAGLAHTSHDANLLGNARFEDVSLQTGAVCFYENANFSGASFCRNAEAQNAPSGWNKRVSSVRVVDGYTLGIYQQTNQTGSNINVTTDTANLATLGFDNALTSYVIKSEPKTNLPAFCSSYPQTNGWQSSKVWYANNRLTYATDSQNNRIPDYSYAGYHYGVDELPTVPVVSTISAVSGDNTANIQNALDAVGNRAPDANGYRGTLQLSPGRYDVYGVIRIKKSGVVLRGSGKGTNAGVDTILYGRGDTPHQRTLLTVGSNDGSPWDSGSSTNVTDGFVPAGSISFNVQNSGLFGVGQEVIVIHPSSQAWINALGGGGATNGVWPAGSKDIPYIRKITKISGANITLDAPIFNHLDKSLAQARVAVVTGRNVISESGIENLRVDIETAGGEDENHVWSAVGVIGAEDSWVTNVSTRYFGYAGIKTAGAIRVTIKDSSATNPVGIRTGSRFYNFDVDDYSQLVLFTGCTAASGRHNFISNGTTSASGVVWHRCTSTGENDSEGHRHWSTGMLFDAIEGSNLNLKLFNRGNYGTQHGWGLAHSTAWNSQATFHIQKPPTAQNYGISGFGTNSTNYPFAGATGYVDIRAGQKLVPESLYEAQMCDRLTQ